MSDSTRKSRGLQASRKTDSTLAAAKNSRAQLYVFLSKQIAKLAASAGLFMNGRVRAVSTREPYTGGSGSSLSSDQSHHLLPTWQARGIKEGRKGERTA